MVIVLRDVLQSHKPRYLLKVFKEPFVRADNSNNVPPAKIISNASVMVVGQLEASK